MNLKYRKKNIINMVNKIKYKYEKMYIKKNQKEILQQKR